MIQEMLKKTLDENKTLSQKLQAMDLSPQDNLDGNKDPRIEGEINNLRLTLNDKINQNQKQIILIQIRKKVRNYFRLKITLKCRRTNLKR